MEKRIGFLKQSAEFLSAIRRVSLIVGRLNNTRFLREKIDFPCHNLQEFGERLWLETGGKSCGSYPVWIEDSVVFNKVWKRVDFMKLVDEFISEKKKFDLALERLKENAEGASEYFEKKIEEFNERILIGIHWCLEKEAYEVLDMKKPSKKRDKKKERKFLEVMEDFFRGIEASLDWLNNQWHPLDGKDPPYEFIELEWEVRQLMSEFRFEGAKVVVYGVFDWERFRRIWKEFRKLVFQIKEFKKVELRKYRFMSRETYPFSFMISSIDILIK